ncbi:hypothetical protein C823_003573 [Eubacterium plexicaudatum ASF492]|nr:hypothetical protein C823_003573 [Eubacterium plexicaudatum ASF492]
MKRQEPYLPFQISVYSGITRKPSENILERVNRLFIISQSFGKGTIFYEPIVRYDGSYHTQYHEKQKGTQHRKYRNGKRYFHIIHRLKHKISNTCPDCQCNKNGAACV